LPIAKAHGARAAAFGSPRKTFIGRVILLKN
jgi:hypothetical protein